MRSPQIIAALGLWAMLAVPGVFGTKCYASSVQTGGAPSAQGTDEARWLAVRYATEAEYHFSEAMRYEERAIQIDPFRDISGSVRNKVLSDANSHWSHVFDLRTRAQLSRIEADQRAGR